VCEDLNGRMGQVRSPKSDATILVAEVNDSIVQVLCHCGTSTEFGAVFHK